MTPLEKIEEARMINPHRFHTCTRFEAFFQDHATKKHIKRNENRALSKEDQVKAKSTERHKNCAPTSATKKDVLN